MPQNCAPPQSVCKLSPFQVPICNSLLIWGAGSPGPEMEARGVVSGNGKDVPLQDEPVDPGIVSYFSRYANKLPGKNAFYKTTFKQYVAKLKISSEAG
ncbi:hypothetical protein TNCT_112441 [Trichonephila clavata]|uniref:Uncharacterized protein n=1 Tax=Trichonephila clavata TaxID=2740835 RepID=A0A8X6LG10_TRICU|nr:hypothetical protein TNCT_112441 [Trichonephila clavata]